MGDGLLVIHAEDDHVVAELLADGLEVGHLFEAEVTPAGPEVDDHGLLAEEGVQADDLPAALTSIKLGAASPTSVPTS